MPENIPSSVQAESYSGPVVDSAQLQSQVAEGDQPSPRPHQPHGLPQQGLNGTFDMAQPHGPVHAGAYHMGAMANALPQPNYRPGPYNSNSSQNRYNHSAVAGQTQPISQYGPHMGHIQNQQYYAPQHTPIQWSYGLPISPSPPQLNMIPRANMPSYYGNQHHASVGFYVGQMPHTYAAQSQNSHHGLGGPYMAGGNMAAGNMAAGNMPHDPSIVPTQVGDTVENATFSHSFQEQRRSPDAHSNIVRGPPRKPRQSGHAIWIGNLPSQTILMDLVHHVCNEAPGLDSLFLISKSNCAFANYKDEASCTAAQQKLHESKFQTVRLVSRLRKNTVEGASGVTAPTGPATAISQHNTAPETKEIATADSTEIKSTSPDADVSAVASPGNQPVVMAAAGERAKFFILKSLTLEDLDLSVRTGLWATQSHNEEALNAAFKSSDHVYLVFSANKSGEYYGYARMASTINEDPDAKIQFAPKAQSVSDVDLPREIPTEATETTPKGRIIDDSTRGTIFWEVVRDELADGQEQDEVASAVTDQDDTVSGVGGLESKTWGKPFKLDWMITNRLPFYRCRGLRNPWNSNREVKIARDGTELEPAVGRRLIGLFNNRASHSSSISRVGPMMGVGPVMVQGSHQPIPMGYPPPYA